MTADFCEVVITADDADWLADFTRTLVDERLAACGHNISAVRSSYRHYATWEPDVNPRNPNSWRQVHRLDATPREDLITIVRQESAFPPRMFRVVA